MAFEVRSGLQTCFDQFAIVFAPTFSMALHTRRAQQMSPLNRCLRYHLDRRQNASNTNAPTWITFHDEDEYLYPVNTSLTIVEALDTYDSTCCATVRGGDEDGLRPPACGVGSLSVC